LIETGQFIGKNVGRIFRFDGITVGNFLTEMPEFFQVTGIASLGMFPSE